MKYLLVFQTSDRGWPPYGHLGRQTSAKAKISARLKITFVDMTYPKGRTESSSHFLLIKRIPLCTFLKFHIHLEINSARLFQNVFYKCLRVLSLVFSKTGIYYEHRHIFLYGITLSRFSSVSERTGVVAYE